MTIIDPLSEPSTHLMATTIPERIGLDRINPIIPGPLKDRLGTGGFGIVYRDPRNPARRCVKQYKNIAVGEEAARLTRLAAVDQWARPSDASLLKDVFAWPLEVFGEEGKITAFTMDIAPDDAYFELRMKNGNKYHRLLQLDYLIDPTYFTSNAIDSSSAVVFSLQDRIELAIKICDSIMALHRYNLVYQDVSSKNIVARHNKPRSCFILDADSITTPEGALAAPITSPTWEVPQGLNPFQIDRARLALMVLRLIVQGHSVRPDVGGPELSQRGYKALADAISETFQEGNEESAERMVRELRLMRDEAHAHEAFQRAVNSRIARLIVQEGQRVKSVADASLVSAAKLHFDREHQLEGANLQQQRRELQALRNQSVFSVDVLSSVGIMPLPTTPRELHDLAFDGYFSDVAQHLTRTGLPKLMADPLMAPIIDRAILEANKGRISAIVAPGKGTVIVEWPPEDFISAAEICLVVAGTIQSRELIQKSPSELIINRQIRAQLGGSVTALVRFGLTTSQGDTVLQNEVALEQAVVIPPIPIAATSKDSKISHTAIDFVDPVEEARLAELALIAKRKKTRNRIVACVLLVLLLVAGIWSYQRFFAISNEPVIDIPYEKNYINIYIDIPYEKNYIKAPQGTTQTSSPTTSPQP